MFAAPGAALTVTPRDWARTSTGLVASSFEPLVSRLRCFGLWATGPGASSFRVVSWVINDMPAAPRATLVRVVRLGAYCLSCGEPWPTDSSMRKFSSARCTAGASRADTDVVFEISHGAPALGSGAVLRDFISMLRRPLHPRKKTTTGILPFSVRLSNVPPNETVDCFQNRLSFGGEDRILLLILGFGQTSKITAVISFSLASGATSMHVT